MPLRPFCSQKGAVGVKQPYIRVVGLEQSRDNNSNGPSNFTLDEVVSFSRFTLIREIHLSVRLIFSSWLVGNGIQRICTEARCICQALLNDRSFNLWSF
jgi:hypothetical protein